MNAAPDTSETAENSVSKRIEQFGNMLFKRRAVTISLFEVVCYVITAGFVLYIAYTQGRIDETYEQIERTLSQLGR